MHPSIEQIRIEQRRAFLLKSGIGLGGVAFSTLLQPTLFGAGPSDARANPGLPGLPHFAPRAKRIIYLFMAGGPAISIRSITSRRCASFTARNCPTRCGRVNA